MTISIVSASSSKLQLTYKPEVTWGVPDTTGGTHPIGLRTSGETLDFQLTKQTSKEINPTRQAISQFLTNAATSGAVNFALSYKEYDPMLAALLMNPWAEYGTNRQSAALPNVTIDVTDSTYDVITFAAAPTGADALANLAVGQFFRVKDGGTTLDPKNQGVFRIAVVNDTQIKVKKAGMVAQTGQSVKLSGSTVSNGEVLSSFSLEKTFTDKNQHFVYTGMMVDKMQLKIASGAEIDGSFDFIGKNSSRSDSQILTGTMVASQTFRTMSGVDGVKNVMIGGQTMQAKYNTFVKDITLKYDNKLIALDAVGTLGSVGVLPADLIDVGGSFSVYLSDGSLYDDFIAYVTQELAFTLTDPAGNGYGIRLPNIDLSNVKANAAQNGQAVMVSADFRALMDPVTQRTIFIDAFIA